MAEESNIIDNVGKEKLSPEEIEKRRREMSDAIEISLMNKQLEQQKREEREEFFTQLKKDPKFKKWATELEHLRKHGEELSQNSITRHKGECIVALLDKVNAEISKALLCSSNHEATVKGVSKFIEEERKKDDYKPLEKHTYKSTPFWKILGEVWIGILTAGLAHATKKLFTGTAEFFNTKTETAQSLDKVTDAIETTPKP